MVLLTSSTISVAISSSIVCMFTFLLFLSGYVMQQQTVRSLQEALHAPPIPKPTPTLPPQFQKNYVEGEVPVIDVAGTASAESDPSVVADDSAIEPIPVAVVTEKAISETVLTESDTTSPDEQNAIILNEAATNSQDASPTHADEDASTTLLPLDPLPPSAPDPATIDATSPSEISSTTTTATTPSPPLRLAYVLTISTPSQICSAILFFLQHHQTTAPSTINPTTYLLLYPSSWETLSATTPAFASALTLMRLTQDTLTSARLIFHPVRTTSAWSGLSSASTHAQLLGELQRWRWDFDRMLYLRTPGFALDVGVLDTALATSAMNLRRNWVSLAQSAAAGANDDPPVMLLSAGKGIRVPRGELRGRLTADGGELGGGVGGAAAYRYFEEEEVEQSRGGEGWDGSVFERYERGREEVCRGYDFGDERPGDVDGIGIQES